MRYVYAITKVANICEMCKCRREIFMARQGKGLFFGGAGGENGFWWGKMGSDRF